MQYLHVLQHSYTKFKKKRISKFLHYFLPLLFLVPFFVIIYRLYIPHINSFGCFDECMNYLGGYFLLKGRTLYSQIFYNHQPTMAYMSWLVLKIFHPTNMFEMLLRYKQILLFVGFIADFFIIKRFKWAGIAFVFIFEITKYYLFGDKFLAESFIVYPMVYLGGLIFLKYNKQKIYSFEYFLVSIFTWFIIFSREPYILAAITGMVMLLGLPNTKQKMLSYGIFLFLCLCTIAYLPIKDYLYEVFTINSQGVGVADAVSTQLFGLGILQVFFYPFFLFVGGQLNEFRILEISLGVAFILSILVCVKNKKWMIVGAMFILLGLSNLRPIVPGQLFYSSFHFIVWWGMLILLTFLFLDRIRNENKLLFYFGYSVIAFGVISYIFLSKSFIFFRVNPQDEFAVNFGETYALGNTIKSLSLQNQTFFIDHMDDVDIAYITSERISPYLYSDFGFVATGYAKFILAREEMFSKNLPDFYYGKTLPKEVALKYQRLYKDSKPSYLYIKKTVYQTIPDNKWGSVKKLGYQKF